jgi:hypothetical protein
MACPSLNIILSIVPRTSPFLTLELRSQRMAEAFATLSIAANIAQFVDYEEQLISCGKGIYNSLGAA